MRARMLTVLLAMAGRLAAPAEATGQYHRLTDAIAVGGTVAKAGSGAVVLTGGPEIGGLVEVPLGDVFRLRGEAAAGFWRFNGYPVENVPGSAMRRHRLTVSLLRSPHAPSPARRWAPYAGGGYGVYFHRFPSGANGGSSGLHGVIGGEYLLRTMRSRWIAAGEVQIHATMQPKRPGGTLPMLSAHVAALFKYRLP